MRKVVFIIPALLLVVILGFFTGYRLTPESAAQANFYVQDAQLVIKTETSIGEVFVYKKSNYYVTVAPQKRAFMWISRISFNTEGVDDKSDPVRLIGWFSTSTGTAMIVQSHDNSVAYVEAGTATNTKREYSNQDGIFVFNWSQAYNPLQDSEPAAYTVDGNKLYTYCYGKKLSTYRDVNELRWYTLDESQDIA